jgi:hypothetical protein
VGVDRDTGVKAEALHAGTGLSGDELDNVGFDSIPESHDRFSRARPGRNAVLQVT